MKNKVQCQSILKKIIKITAKDVAGTKEAEICIVYMIFVSGSDQTAAACLWHNHIPTLFNFFLIRDLD